MAAGSVKGTPIPNDPVVKEAAERVLARTADGLSAGEKEALRAEFFNSTFYALDRGQRNALINYLTAKQADGTLAKEDLKAITQTIFDIEKQPALRPESAAWQAEKQGVAGSMKLWDFLKKYDIGEGIWGGASNRELRDGEIRGVPGGFAAFQADVQKLSTLDRKIVASLVMDKAARNQAEAVIDPKLMVWVKEWDKGNFLDILGLTKEDWRLSKDEINKSPARFFETLGNLSHEQQLRVAAMIDHDVFTSPLAGTFKQRFPHFFDANDFAAARFTSAQDAKKADEVRNFLRQKLGVFPESVKSGFGLRNVEWFKHVPATPEEQLLKDMQKELAGQKPMNILALHQYLVGKGFPDKLRLPQLDVALLREGVVQRPGVFEGKTVSLSGHAQHLRTDERRWTSLRAHTHSDSHYHGDGDWHTHTDTHYHTVYHSEEITLHQFHQDSTGTGGAVQVQERDYADSEWSYPAVSTRRFSGAATVVGSVSVGTDGAVTVRI